MTYKSKCHILSKCIKRVKTQKLQLTSKDSRPREERN